MVSRWTIHRASPGGLFISRPWLLTQWITESRILNLVYVLNLVQCMYILHVVDTSLEVRPCTQAYIHVLEYSCRSTAVCTCTHRRCCCATLTSFVQNCRLCRMATLRPGLQQEYDRWWPILSAGGSQCYWLLAASFWGRQEAVLVLPGGVPGGQFCESCIFERSYSTAFTYHIRYFWQVPAAAVWHTQCTCVYTKF